MLAWKILQTIQNSSWKPKMSCAATIEYWLLQEQQCSQVIPKNIYDILSCNYLFFFAAESPTKFKEIHNDNQKYNFRDVKLHS